MRKTVGEVMIDLLEFFGVDTVFGIPGVHTVELYRGLSASGIRHITPRLEQCAGYLGVELEDALSIAERIDI